MPDQNDVSLTITLKVAQVNILLELLDQAPHRVAAPMIREIQQQCAPQLAPKGEDETAPTMSRVVE